MTATYKLSADELSPDIVEAIKKAFKKRMVSITFTDDDMDETEYLLLSDANRKQLLEAMKDLDEGRGIKMTIDEIKEKMEQEN